MAPSNRQPLGRPIQLLYQRPAMGTDVCPHLSLSAVLRPRLPQSASLGWPTACVRRASTSSKCANAFTRCAKPEAPPATRRDSLTPWDLLHCGQKAGWRASRHSLPPGSGRNPGCRPSTILLSQVEFCDNLIFRHAARRWINSVLKRLLDANRTIGQPNKITVIFGRRIKQALSWGKSCKPRSKTWTCPAR